MFARIKYYLLMHLIVVAWGFTGILGKLILLDFYQIVFFRVTLAGISLFLFLKWTNKTIKLPNRRTFLKVIGVGLIVTIHWLTFFKAIQTSTASLAVLCLSTTTLHVCWLEPLIMKRKFSWLEFSFGLLIILGIGFVSGHIDADQYQGLIWGLISAFLAASFSVFNLKLRRENISASSLTLYEMLTGMVFLLIILGGQGKLDVHFFKMTWSDFYWLLFLGILCTSAAFVWMIDVVNRIGAFSASLIINLEPVYSILLAIILLHENELLGFYFYWGAVFIILLVFLNPLISRRMSYYKKSKTIHPKAVRTSPPYSEISRNYLPKRKGLIKKK